MSEIEEKRWYHNPGLILIGFGLIIGAVGFFFSYRETSMDNKIIDHALKGNKAAMRMMQVSGPHWFKNDKFKNAALEGNPYALEIMGLEKK